jgi:hypothetical protein
MDDRIFRGLTLGMIFIAVPIALRALTGRTGALGQARLRYSLAARVFAIVPLVVFLAGASALALGHHALAVGQGRGLLVVLLFFGGTGLTLVLEFYRVDHDYGAFGWTYRSPWSRQRRLEWSEVTSIGWRPTIKWLDFLDKDGRRFHVSPMLGGLGPFAQIALERLTPGVLVGSSEARAVLRLMAAVMPASCCSIRDRPAIWLPSSPRSRDSTTAPEWDPQEGQCGGR